MNSGLVMAEREQAERSTRECAVQALHECEERYRLLFASVTDYVYAVTVGGGQVGGTLHGPGCEAVTGYTPREFESDPGLWYSMVDERDRSAVLAQVECVFRGEPSPPLEHRIRHKSGGIRWIRNTPVPRRGADGTLKGYDGLVSDITERREAAVALQQSQERLALVIQGSGDGIWDWNLGTNEVYFSPCWKSMLGYEDHELANHFSSWERLLHPDDRTRALAAIQTYLSGQSESYELEHRLRHKDGGYRWILARGLALRDAAGKPIRMAGSHLDLTERKRAEEQLLAEKVRAAKFQTIATLAAGVAHEVKNPLQTITLGLDYLDRSLAGADKEAAQVLAEIRNAAARANATVRGLLNFSATEGFEAHAEDWNALIERSLNLLTFEFATSKTAVVRHLAGDLPPVRANRQKMEQVLLDLFLNSLQAMSQGGLLTVSTRNARAGEDDTVDSLLFPQFLSGDRLVITEVLDTGPGCSEADLPRVFDPFFTTKAVGEGTGLGLAVVRQIVELHGGAIELRNAPTGGAIVTLVLRAQRKQKP